MRRERDRRAQSRRTSYLLADASAQFSRGSEAAQMAAASLSWVADDIRRGDAGATLIETRPVYQPLAPRALSGTGWTGGTGTVTASQADGPDGATLTASRVQVTGTQYGPLTSYGITGLLAYSASCWARRRPGDGVGTLQGLLGSGSPGTTLATVEALTEAWEYVAFSGPDGAWIPVDGRASVAPMTAIAQDVLLDLLCFEAGARYPTTTARVQRDRDTWQWLAAEVPAALRTGNAVWTVSIPWSSTSLLSGDVRTIASFGGASDELRLRHTGSDVRLEAVTGGVVRASSAALTWTGTRATPRRFTFGARPAAGIVSVDGVDGAAGTAWTFPATQVRVGGTWGGANEIDAFISLPSGA